MEFVGARPICGSVAFGQGKVADCFKGLCPSMWCPGRVSSHSSKCPGESDTVRGCRSLVGHVGMRWAGQSGMRCGGQGGWPWDAGGLLVVCGFDCFVCISDPCSLNRMGGAAVR